MNRKQAVSLVSLAALMTASMEYRAEAHITGWITINNDGGTTANTVADVGNSTIIGGAEGYQTLAAFPTITLADGEYIELTGTLAALGRTASSAADLQRLRDQIRLGLFRAPGGDPLQAQNLTGYIIEHRSETREIRNPIAAPATNQSPFVSARSTSLTGGHSTAADPQFGSGTGNTNFTESDVVAGEDVALTITYRIARDGANLDITGSIAGTPGVIDPNATVPPGQGDGVFLEQFALQDYDPAINLSGTGSDDFDFMFNRIGFLIGGNVDLDLGNPIGDFDADGAVDGDDLAKWQGDFGAGNGSDGDADGDTDGTDFLLWQQNLGQAVGRVVLTDVEVVEGVSAGVVTGAIPEPSSLLLLGVAAFGAMVVRHPRP